jgi:hypothetical protein
MEKKKPEMCSTVEGHSDPCTCGGYLVPDPTTGGLKNGLEYVGKMDKSGNVKKQSKGNKRRAKRREQDKKDLSAKVGASRVHEVTQILRRMNKLENWDEKDVREALKEWRDNHAKEELEALAEYGVPAEDREAILALLRPAFDFKKWDALAVKRATERLAADRFTRGLIFIEFEKC